MKQGKGARVRRVLGATVFGASAMVLAGAPAHAAEGGTCLPWDQPVTLEGYVLDGIFPGPPEYEDIGDGDMELHTQLLYLTEPVCVEGADPMEAEPIAATELVQLACPDLPLSDMRGRVVTLRGSLFSQHTGYHRTPALLMCGE